MLATFKVACEATKATKAVTHDCVSYLKGCRSNESGVLNVLINAVCKIHRFLQFSTADKDPAGNFEKLTICRTAR